MGAIKNTRNAQKTQLDVCIGKEGLPVGELAYVKDGAREYSVFAYSQDWLRHPAHFAISPDLALVSGHQVRKPPTKDVKGQAICAATGFAVSLDGSSRRISRPGSILYNRPYRSGSAVGSEKVDGWFVPELIGQPPTCLPTCPP